jgi:hypothetical protein
MASEGTGIVIGVFSVVILVLFYLAIVGHIVFSYQVFFSFLDRVAFILIAFAIILLLYFSNKSKE